ncbi:glycosyltransferase family 1 protein [Endozoicomonas sp. OPT23]|uniref:glycosyltransferase family 4 protein n=1 Tax=Endozoicomonas sp. OPT23 TaxID=2072845 RepID=UPI00129A0EFD|nr:glycosyltransferase family 4 protein [Endozoicomonas sp. OPT23]MRI34315.1 glycosyltransferase family 1 protein [Endozoicomonas sp. OPT23]
MNLQSHIILFVVNAPEFFISHRLPLAVAAQKAGFEVHVVTADGSEVQTIKSQGFTHHVVPFARSGQNPLNELSTLFTLVRLFRRLKPSLVHLITIKPVLYGGIAARLTGIDSVVSAVSGLGTVFLASSLTARIRRTLVTQLYRSAFKHDRLAVIFQNPDDRDSLLKLKALKIEQARMIRGSGVALVDYPFEPEPEGKSVVVMAARLLRDKGVIEFVGAAKLLKERGVPVVFRLIGSPDSGNPTSVTQSELDQWAADGNVELLGYRKDIAAQYSAANIVCLPSYREGLPKSLVEAAACGRAVVTTDVPGCRDAITPNVTGLLVDVKNSIALADAIQKLVDNSSLRKRLGRAGRSLAEEAFAIDEIVDQHMGIYLELLEP